MRREEVIYIQTGKCVRNRDHINVNMSSDFCINDNVDYIISGTTQIPTSFDVCELSGITINDIYTASTQCFYDNGLLDDCFESLDWLITVNENGVDVYENTFYTMTSITGNTPTETEIIDGIEATLTNINYNFEINGTELTIRKPFGVKTLIIKVCTQLNIANGCQMESTDCDCPEGYVNTANNETCAKYTTTGATYNGSSVTVTAGNTTSDYGIEGTNFYESIVNKPLPIEDVGTTLVDASGTTVTLLQNVRNSLWGDSTPTIDGRLNEIGVWGVGIPNNEWVGFTYCLDILSGGTYSLGIGADDKCRFKINGELIVEINNPSSGFSHKRWFVLPLELNSGLNIIEMEGLNEGSLAAFGAEIYDATTAELSGMTLESELSAVTIFSTSEMIGQEFQLGETIGYSCPVGYSLNGCGETLVCTKIEFADHEICDFSGTCETDCSYTACTQSYDFIDNTSNSVYIITDETNIDMTINFTGDTSFVNENTEFKYSVYKYDSLSSSFRTPSVYNSPSYKYVDFSGLTEDILNITLPINSLFLDGDYIIKGFFKFDACTEFANRLGLSVDTSNHVSGKEYGLYDEDIDGYFVSLYKPSKPTIEDNENFDTIDRGFVVYSLFPTSGETIFEISEHFGSVIVALNGLTLASGYDYDLDGNTLTLSGATVPTDVITVAHMSSDENAIGIGLINEVEIVGAITSGLTDNQGVNKIYYNTDQNKYEYYLDIEAINGDSIVITLNGVTLANNIDYYQSTTNSKRIILNGDIITGDVINVFYRSNADLVGGLYTTTLSVNFSVDITPQLSNGYFVLEVTNDADTDFNSIRFSGSTNYIGNVSRYTINTELSDVSGGDKLIYRIRNVKNYVTVSGDIINTETISDTIPLVIMTNIFDSY